MKHHRYRILYFALAQFAIACITVAITPIGPTLPLEHFCIGAVLGTLFGQTTLAAAWVALGPGPLLIRLPLSILWVVAGVIAMAGGLVIRRPPDVDAAEITSIVAQTLALQWTAALLPLGALAGYFRLRLRHVSDANKNDGPRQQFGISQLMIFTALIAVLLGIGRVIVSSEWLRLTYDRELPIFLYLVGCAVVMTLPLIFAAFLSRNSVIAILGALGFLVIVSAVEMPLLNATFGRGGGPDLLHIFWINCFTTVWVLANVLAIRGCGYQFGFEDKAAYEVVTKTPPEDLAP